jgi:hypothetical protein
MLQTDNDRGPMVAAGLVTLAVAVLLVDIRFTIDWSAGGRLVVTAIPALLALGVAWFAPQDDVPPPWLSAILVVELVLVLLALGNLADALGADGEFQTSGSLTWVGLLATTLAVVSSRRHNSAVMALLAGVVGTVTLLAAVDWIFDLDSPLRTFRWFLMLSAILLGAGGMSVRSSRPRHGVARACADVRGRGVCRPVRRRFDGGLGVGAVRAARGGGAGGLRRDQQGARAGLSGRHRAGGVRADGRQLGRIALAGGLATRAPRGGDRAAGAGSAPPGPDIRGLGLAS